MLSAIVFVWKMMKDIQAFSGSVLVCEFYKKFSGQTIIANRTLNTKFLGEKKHRSAQDQGVGAADRRAEGGVAGEGSAGGVLEFQVTGIVAVNIAEVSFRFDQSDFDRTLRVGNIFSPENNQGAVTGAALGVSGHFAASPA